ncbi:DUF305 domain-containing protein [Rhodococcus opacus]|uniref:DUF305 domain-containing protein n=1 Tax=Rhodococcus opacus TaxID=37919 RepID=UPI001C4906AA|nr:DUF305 domain-containing protein [Rhodococcus opacus]MBV6760616.1 DUF305 domain-containing protein [Rhodococcus opacus]
MAEPNPVQASTEPGHDDPRRRYRAVTTGLIVVIALLAGILAGFWIKGWLDGDNPPPPSADSVDVGFAQDMSVHHSQAVEMSAMALANAADPAVRTLAYDVVTTQQSQVGTMQGWLNLWDRPPLGPGPYMQWMPTDSATGSMQHSMPGMEGDMSTTGSSPRQPMPGMATTTELDELRKMTGPAFDVRYLQLLLRHHQGGIPMAQYAADNASVPAVAALARQIVNTQEAESTAIRQLLETKGAQPLPMN